jgi:hypothetical protein
MNQRVAILPIPLAALLILASIVLVNTIRATPISPQSQQIIDHPKLSKIEENFSDHPKSYEDHQFHFTFDIPPDCSLYVLDNYKSTLHARTYHIRGALDQYIEVFRKPHQEDFLTWYRNLYSKPLQEVQLHVTKTGAVEMLEGTLPNSQEIHGFHHEGTVVLLTIAPLGPRGELNTSQGQLVESIRF